MEALDLQAPALAELVARIRAFYAGQWRQLPVQPRWPSLLTGPTGVGKTTIAAMAAAAPTVRAEMLRVSAPGWMPAGAVNRGTRETISHIAGHVARNPRTLLVIDELDKLIHNSGDPSWKSYIRGEIFELLDGRWPAGLQPPDDDDDDAPTPVQIPELTQKLRDTVFILAIGTFQDWFDGSNTRRTIGFGRELDTGPEELTADIVAEKLPRELTNRLNSQLIRIPELKTSDYHRIAEQTAVSLPESMREAFRTETNRRIAGAIASKKGVRFLEEAMMQVLIHLPPDELDPPVPESAAEPEPFDPCLL